MRIKTLLVSVVAAAAVLVGMPAAHADDPITVTAADIDATSNACFYQSLAIGGMTVGHTYTIGFYAPDGGLLWGTSWTGNTQYPEFVTGFCSSLTEGHYSVVLDGTTYGGFNVYRPQIDVATSTPAARTKGKRHAVSAVLSIHGKRMASATVAVRKHVSGKPGIKSANRTTDAAGRVRAVCPRGHRCTVQFNYGNGFTLSRVVQVGHR